MASLIFTYAAMNAGKSASLLTAAHNYKERGMGVLVLKPAIDTRDSVCEVVSRIGIKQEANIITDDMDIFEFYKWAEAQKDIHCVFVDEAQFLKTEQVHQLSRIVEGSKELLAIADKLIELKAVCHCGKKAIMTARLMEDGTPVKEGNQICIGDEIYVSLCRKHWNELTKKLG